jgi:hypothetical protein
MKVLIDHANVPDAVRSQGVLHLADLLFERLRPFLLESARLDLRLYGGWFQEDKLTHAAQSLAAEIAASFPYPMWIRDRAPAQLVPLSAALAHSLEMFPRKLIQHTYRLRPPARRFSCEDPGAKGCTTDPCPLGAMVEFVNSGNCPQTGCGLRPKDLFQGVGEQKLVDTMLVADLIHLGRLKQSAVAVVTSDDDVWPGIIDALVSGVHVFHVRTGSAQSQARYMEGVPGTYTQLEL